MHKIFILVILAILLPACGGSSVVKPSKSESSSSAKKGGYYLDDGPGKPPANLDSVPDAVPKAEPPIARLNRPYVALGNNYTPMTEYVPYKKTGIASWYGKRYHGQKTSSGEIYNMYEMTGAHTILPIPSYAKVTNKATGESVIIRINDRGPFHSDRIIDLSYVAAYKLGIVESGSGMVEVEAIDTRVSNMVKVNADSEQSAATTNSIKLIPEPNLVLEKTPPAVVVAAVNDDDKPITTTNANNSNTSIQNAPGDYVQLGSFKTKSNADNLLARVENLSMDNKPKVFSQYNNGLYQVRVGPFSTRAEAEKMLNIFGSALGLKPALIHNPNTQ